MTDFYTKALSTFGRSNALELTKTVEHIPNMFRAEIRDLAGVVNHLHQVSAANIMQSDTFISIQPKTTVPAALLNGGRLKFSTSKNQISRIKNGYIKITVSNTTGAAVTLTPTQLWLQRKEIYGDSGGNSLYIEEDLEPWMHNILFSDSEWINLAPMFNTNATYDRTGSAQADGTTRDYYIPLIGFLSSAHLSLAGLANDLEFELTFKPFTLIGLAGTLPNVTNCQLLLRGMYEDPATSALRAQQYQSPYCVLRYLDNDSHKADLTLTANSQYDIVLSGIRGLVAYLIIFVRAKPVTAANQANFIGAISTFDIVDESSKSIIGSYHRNYDETAKLIYPETFDNSFALNSGGYRFFIVPFSEDPITSFKTGANLGFQPFDTHNRLRFTTSPGLTTGSYEVQVLAKVYNHIEINQGHLTKIS